MASFPVCEAHGPPPYFCYVRVNCPAVGCHSWWDGQEMLQGRTVSSTGKKEHGMGFSSSLASQRVLKPKRLLNGIVLGIFSSVVPHGQPPPPFFLPTLGCRHPEWGPESITSVAFSGLLIPGAQLNTRASRSEANVLCS